MAGISAVVVVACGPAEQDVTIRGTVIYAEYSSGEILLKAVEEWTEDCNLFNCDLQTPGDTVARERLAAPGPFSLSARVQRDPQLSLLAFALGQGQDERGCEAGAWTSLDAADHDDVELVLVPGSCPALK